MIRGSFSGINPEIIGKHRDNRDDYFQKVPSRFILRDSNILCCPTCGCDNVHLGENRTLQGHTTSFTSGDGTAVAASDRHKHCRGSAVELLMYCESGHEFAWRLEFHKGATFFAMYARDYDIVQDRPSELWRD